MESRGAVVLTQAAEDQRDRVAVIRFGVVGAERPARVSLASAPCSYNAVSNGCHGGVRAREPTDLGC